MRPKGSEKTPGSGRKRGTPNKATAELKALAQEHTDEAMKRLVALAKDPKHPSHFAAIKELLDRGYGKPSQSHEHTGADGGDIVFRTVIEKRAD